MLKNMSLALFVVNQTARCIGVNYDPAEKQYGSDGAQTEKITPFKTLDPSIKVDDYVVIETGQRHGYTVARVKQVDLPVDFQNDKEMRWIACRIDVENHQARKAGEVEVIAAIQKAQNDKIRKDLATDLMAGADATIKSLALTKPEGVPVGE